MIYFIFSDPFLIVILPISIFFIGIFSLITYKKNLILTLISLEIVFLASNLNFLLVSFFIDDIIGYMFSLFILTVTGCEVAVGLALIILFYRIKNNIYIDLLKYLKG